MVKNVFIKYSPAVRTALWVVGWIAFIGAFFAPTTSVAVKLVLMALARVLPQALDQSCAAATANG